MKVDLGHLILRSAGILFLIVAMACDSDPGHGGRSSAQWVSQLRTGEDTNKVEAARALGKILTIRPDYPIVVAALVGALRDTSDAVRIAAAHALTADGVDTRAAVDGLHEVMHDSAHADVRAAAVMIVSALGPARAGALLPYLCELLTDSSPKVRAAAVEAIGHIGPAALPEVPEISRMMRDSSADVRQSVIRALLNLGAPASITLPVARAGLKDSSAAVRSSAVDALRYLRQAAVPATDDLVIALRDSSETVVHGAMLALGSIGPAAARALPLLRQMRNTQPPQVHALINETIAILEGRPALRDGGSEPSPADVCRRNPGDPRC